MRLFRTPTWLHRYFGDYIWRIPTHEKVLYLSFDDGPDPEITPFVLEQLALYQAKAVFFCVGDNLRKYPQVVNEILSAGHLIGNHTYNHLKGWNTSTEVYIENILECQNHSPLGTTLFRPPYGRIKKSQGDWLKKEGFQIVMWDILTYDYDASLNVHWAIKKIIKRTRKGSIVVFHDSKKAYAQLKVMLPLYLKHMTENGYSFQLIPQ